MTTRKRLFAFLLCLVMLVSLLPVTALAAGGGSEELLIADGSDVNADNEDADAIADQAMDESFEEQEEEILVPVSGEEEIEQPVQADEPEIPEEPEAPTEPETPDEAEDEALLQEVEQEEEFLLQTQAAIAIDETNFPDSGFRSYVSSNFDIDNDGNLSETERNDVYKIYTAGRDFASLQGVEYFPNLSELECYYDSALKSLDVSQNTKLRNLVCNGCALTSLNVSGNAKLEKLTCNNNKLTNLDVSHCTALTELNCSWNSLTAMDMSPNTALTSLIASENPITSVNVASCTALEYLDLQGTALNALNVTGNTRLKSLSFYGGKFTSLDLTKNTLLESLTFHSTLLSSLDLSKNTQLTSLYYGGSNITSLDLTANTKLEMLWVNGTPLETVDISKCPLLYTVHLYSNDALTSLDIRNCPLLSAAVARGTMEKTDFCIRYTLDTTEIEVDFDLELITDEEREPVREYDGSFKCRSADGSGRNYDTELDCYYNDNFFDTDSYAYNHSLARMSLNLAMSAFNSLEATPYDFPVDPSEFTLGNKIIGYDLANSPAKNVATLMDNCGFSKIAVNEDFLITTDYGSLNSGHNIGICMGTKKLADGTPLIAVALRGAGYGDEWIGNFTVYNSGTYHKGFDMSSNEVVNELRKYVAAKGITGNVKVWITGYSRAAATANLAAGKLADNGTLAEGCSVASNAIYAYCFETPRGTKSYGGSQYRGIWNIVNPTDPVPMVAMEKWGYGRFGRTGFLPSKNTNSQYFKNYKSTILTRFNEYSGLNKWVFPTVAAQEYLLTNLVNALATALGSDSTSLTMVFADQVQGIFKDNPGNSSTLEKALKAGLSAGILTILGVKPIVDAVKLELGTIIISHYPEMTRAWMNTIPAEMIDFGSVKIRYAKSNCPVDLAVYDENDTLQLRIIDDVVYPEDDADIEAIVDTDGQKVVCIPSDKEARIEVLATDDGEFNYSVQEYDLAEGDVTRTVNYYEVEIHEGDSLTGTVSTADEGEYLLLDEDGVQLPPYEDLSGSAVESYTINVAAEGPGSVEGAGMHTKGDFAQVTATAEDGASFTGWYAGESKLSDEAVYRFPVSGDVTLTAHFAEAAPVTYTVSFSANGGGGSKDDETVTEGSSYTLPGADTFSPPTGKEFDCWSVQIGQAAAEDKEAGAGITVTADITVTAQWKDLPAPTVRFKDVTDPKAFYYEPVYWAVAKGITTGTTPTTFAPNNGCTRGQIVTFLWRAAGKPEPTVKNPFKDIKSTDFCYKAVLWAFENGITTGTTPTTFSPNNLCTREQCVTFLWRSAGKPTGSPNAGFTDVKPGAFYADAVSWAFANGVTTGITPTKFGVGLTCTRAQIVTFIYRYMNG